MAQFETKSDLKFVPLFEADVSGQPSLTALCKATFDILESGRVALAEEQHEILPAGLAIGDPGDVGYVYEPETALTKVATDVVLVGSARATSGKSTRLDVGLRVGPVQKVVRVFGDRAWVKTGGRIIATDPRPFERIPLAYQRAFGGWDRADRDENNWVFDPRNPVGVGYGDPLRFVEEGKVPMPNIEDPQHLIRRYGDSPPPAGFGFISPHWQPRAQYAGTYDEDWQKTRKPLLPTDFDLRFFNAASRGLIAPGYLRGDEEVMIVNASPVPKLRFRLPGIPPPVCKVELRNGRSEALRANLDTVIINTDDMLLFLLWRNYMRVPNGPHDVASIEVTADVAVPLAATA